MGSAHARRLVLPGIGWLVLLAGCSDAPPVAGSPGSSSSGSETTGAETSPTTATTVAETSTSTSSASSDSGVLDGTSTTGSTTGSTGTAGESSSSGATTGTGSETTGGPPLPDTCCAPLQQPGCPDDPSLEACVCGTDPFCCDTWWDEICVQTAVDGCELECTLGCCSPHGLPGCDDVAVDDCVCALEDDCCDTAWDGDCVILAQYACGSACGLPPPNMGDCCMPQPAPGCGDVAVAECACMVDGDCCVMPWSEVCIQTSVNQCGIECEGYEPIDPCCYTQPGPLCGNAAVEACVCAFDPFCCDVAWDGICVGEAQNPCMLDCSGA